MNKRTEQDLSDLTKNYISAVASRVGKTEDSNYVLHKVLPKLLVDCVGVDTVSFMDNPFAIGGKFTISVMREEFIKKASQEYGFFWMVSTLITRTKQGWIGRIDNQIENFGPGDQVNGGTSYRFDLRSISGGIVSSWEVHTWDVDGEKHEKVRVVVNGTAILSANKMITPDETLHISVEFNENDLGMINAVYSHLDKVTRF